MIMDHAEILKILPHRYPFLLVDRVIEFEPGKKLVAFKNVTLNEPFFEGHFPDHPVMPGVLVLEALAQACALLGYKSEGISAADKVTYLMGVDNARWRKPVLPGDRLELHVEVVRQKGPVWKQRGVAKVDGQVVAEADFLATMVDRQAPVKEKA